MLRSSQTNGGGRFTPHPFLRRSKVSNIENRWVLRLNSFVKAGTCVLVSAGNDPHRPPSLDFEPPQDHLPTVTSLPGFNLTYEASWEQQSREDVILDCKK